MKKFCPNCGHSLDKDDKFCSYCGQVLTDQSINKNGINSTIGTQNSKGKNKARIWWIISIVVMVLFVGGGYLFYSQYNKQQTITKIDKMPKQKLAGLTVVYAHSHYKNAAWNKTYNEAMKGNMYVQRYKKYNLNGSLITAKGSNYIYVINNRVIFTTYKEKDNGPELELSDGKKTLGQVKAVDAYQQVKKKQFQELQKINDQKAPVNFPIRKLAVMAALSHDKSNNTQDEINLSFKHRDKMLFKENGRYRLQLGADGLSATVFRCEGKEVVIKYIEPQKEGPASDWPTKTIRVDIDDLVEEYYHTADQKKFVNELANKVIFDKSVNNE